MEEDWDLHAVVRGYCGAAFQAAPSFSSYDSPAETLCSLFFLDDAGQQPFRDLFSASSQSLELDDLWKPFYSSNVHPSSSLHHQRDNKHKPLSFSSKSSQHRSKRRKNQLKKVVCHISAEGLSSDVWSWRKYGQKPIKGSPYPRGYYRCSSSKGCSARKQVERSKTDPTMFVITYTSEHNHPAPNHKNSLAGSTRQKSPENPLVATTSSGGSFGGLSPTTPLTSTMEETSKTPVADDEVEITMGSIGEEEGDLFVDLQELPDDVFASPEFFGDCLSPPLPGGWVAL